MSDEALPPTPTSDIADIMHGTVVFDPYRWLENGAEPSVRAWTEAQNAHARAFLDAVPNRARVETCVTRVVAVGSMSAPVDRAGALFYTRRDGLQNQAVLYVRDAVTGTERVLVDPNHERTDGTVTLDWWLPSPDGTKLVYGLSPDGSEMSTLYVVEVATGELLPDRIPYTRYASIAWEVEGTGFFYTRYPVPGSVPPGQEYYNRRLFYHRLGTDPATDTLVFGEGRQPEEFFNAKLSPDGRFLLVTASRTFDEQDVYLCDLGGDETFVPVAEGLRAAFDGEILGRWLYLRTNLHAPNYRIVAVDVLDPKSPWREIVGELPSRLEGFTIAGGKLVCSHLHHATSRLSVYALDGTHERDLDVPEVATVTEVRGRWNSPDLFFAVTSFVQPVTVRWCDLETAEWEVFARIDSPFDPHRFQIEQVRYASKDGTPVTMFLVHRRGLVRNGDNPTLLTGYGGFNISRTPEFLGSLLCLIDEGCVYALPNLRGGGEYGESWHQAGMGEHKQNVFDDFIAAAEYLIGQGYTRPDRLAISGGSNGGLLVGAAVTQRPDLFRAVVCQVPLLDMLRYHKFLIGRLWIPEYGSPDDPEAFPHLAAYSPYHQVRDGVAYPAMLLMTAESDTRVDPLHARKMAARLQAANASPHPILLRVESRAGHGVGKPTAKRIAESVDFLAFLRDQIGMNR